MPLRARTPTGVDADDSWGPEDVARLVGTGPWKLAGSVGGKMIRLDGVHFLAHGYLTSSKGHGRWAHSTKGTIEVQVCATRFKLRPQFGVQGWSMASPDDATDVAATTMPGHQAQEATGVRITAVLAASAEALGAWSPPARFPPDATSRRLEGSGPYKGPAGSVLLLRAGVLQASGRELGQYTRWSVVSPTTLLFTTAGAAAASSSADAPCARGLCVELTDCFVLRLPPAPGLLSRLGLAPGDERRVAPPRYAEDAEVRSLEWILRPPASVCEDPCAGLTLRRLTAADREASPLARALEAGAAAGSGGPKWTWAGFGGLSFMANGQLATPWGGGVWGAPPEAQTAGAPALLAEFAGQKHLLRARVSGSRQVSAMESTRCHDNDRAEVRLAGGQPPTLVS
eukprot:scaffold74204_cov27-Tisochrysis_lutea.AAC.1